VEIRIGTGRKTYPILVYAAMLPWPFFASAVTKSSNSVVENGSLLTKVYFPMLVVPVSSAVVSFIDFRFAFIVMLALMAWYRFTPSWRMLSLPFLRQLLSWLQRVPASGSPALT
jgi:lipopolysaccharide transport system permease protein